jgi:hypothetical protein
VIDTRPEAARRRPSGRPLDSQNRYEGKLLGCPVSGNGRNSRSRQTSSPWQIGHTLAGRFARRVHSPLIAQRALAGVALGDVGELALEGGCDREAVQPFRFGFFPAATAARSSSAFNLALALVGNVVEGLFRGEATLKWGAVTYRSIM